MPDPAAPVHPLAADDNSGDRPTAAAADWHEGEQVVSALCRQATAGMPGLDLDPRTVLRTTDKAITVPGALLQTQVVAKLLHPRADAYWRTRFAHEAAAYRAFTAAPPPFPVPDLVHADADLLILQRLPGAPPHTDRYPSPLPPPAVEAMLTALATFPSWQPPPGPLALPAADLPARLCADVADGWLHPDDADRILAVADQPLVFTHGDALPSNYLWQPGLPGAWIDFEHAGMRPPMHDEALLAVMLGMRHPHLAERITDLAADRGHSASYTANLAVLIARERRLHARLWPAEAAERTHYLTEAAADTSRRLRRLTGRAARSGHPVHQPLDETETR